jgi:hypothetical protein
MKNRKSIDLTTIIDAIHNLIMQIHTNTTQKTAKVATLHQSQKMTFLTTILHRNQLRPTNRTIMSRATAIQPYHR